MSWWAAIPVIGDVVKGVGGAVTDVAHVWKEDAEAGAQRRHAETMAVTEQDMATMQQFATEFSAPRDGWWDSFINGLNRLPRPLITFGILSMFVIAPLWPERFVLIAQGWQLIPEGAWALLGIVIAFYFGGRMQLKSQDFALTKAQIEASKRIVAMRREPAPRVKEDRGAPEPAPAETPGDQPLPDSRASGAPAISNRVIQEWRRRRAPAA
jgi:Holin of 3TMs, for gene-transfer release